MTDVLGKIGTPTLYEHEIPLTETTEAAAADGEELTQHEDAFAKLTSDLPKPYRAVAELVQGLWEGDYEKEIKELFASDPDAQNSILSESQQTKSSKLSKGFRAAAAVPQSASARVKYFKFGVDRSCFLHPTFLHGSAGAECSSLMFYVSFKVFHQTLSMFSCLFSGCFKV